jgi:hypothetical protein
VSHWTEDLFVNHPELFVKALEERVSIAGDEVDLFLKYLGQGDSSLEESWTLTVASVDIQSSLEKEA